MRNYFLIFLFLHISSCIMAASSGDARINIKFSKKSNAGPFKVYIRDNYYSSLNSDGILPKTEIRIKNFRAIDNVVNIIIDSLDHPCYVDIVITDEDGNLMVPRLIVKPGDQVAMQQNGEVLMFSGRDALKYSCQNELSKTKFVSIDDPISIMHIKDYFARLDSVALSSFSVLRSYKNKIADEDYHELELDIIYYFQTIKYGYIRLRGDQPRIQDSIREYLNGYNDVIWNLDSFGRILKNKGLINLNSYQELFMNQFELDSCMLQNRPPQPILFYNFFNRNFYGAVRELLIYKLIEKNVHGYYDISEVVNDVVRTNNISNKYIRDFFDEVENLLPGRTAFEFSLKDFNDNLTNLSDFKGKMVLIDFYKRSCGACEQLHPYLDSIGSRFKDSGLVIVSVYITPKFFGKDDWEEMINSGRYTSNSNINLIGIKEEPNGGKILHKYLVKAFPTTILIDRNGKFLNNFVSPVSDGGKSLISEISNNL